jgi:hypothetical protein
LWVRDGLLALVVTAVGQVELVLLGGEVNGSRPLQHAAFAVMTGSLVIRRLRPLAAVVAAAAGLAFQTLLGDAPAGAGFVAILIVTYSVAQYADRRRDAVLGLLAVLAASELYPFVAGDVSVADEWWWPTSRGWSAPGRWSDPTTGSARESRRSAPGAAPPCGQPWLSRASKRAASRFQRATCGSVAAGRSSNA